MAERANIHRRGIHLVNWLLGCWQFLEVSAGYHQRPVFHPALAPTMIDVWGDAGEMLGLM